MTDPLDPLDTARQMWADDPASRALGMELRDARSPAGPSSR